MLQNWIGTELCNGRPFSGVQNTMKELESNSPVLWCRLTLMLIKVSDY